MRGEAIGEEREMEVSEGEAIEGGWGSENDMKEGRKEMGSQCTHSFWRQGEGLDRKKVIRMDNTERQEGERDEGK